MYIETTEKLLEFIEKSPTAFQAVDEMKKRFTEGGFQVLSEREHWNLIPGGKYVVTRNNSALIALQYRKIRRLHFILWQATVILRHSR